MPYEFPIIINGEMQKTDDILEIKSPFDGRMIGKTYRVDSGMVEQAIQSSENAFQQTKKMPVYERAEKLQKTVDGLINNREEFAQIICAESGKPIKFSRLEVDRAINTFSDALEESKRMRGQEMPLDFEPGSKGRWAIIKRFPIGKYLNICCYSSIVQGRG